MEQGTSGIGEGFGGSVPESQRLRVTGPPVRQGVGFRE